MYILPVYYSACAYTKLVWDSRSGVFGGSRVILKLGNGYGAIIIGSCFLVDGNFSMFFCIWNLDVAQDFDGCLVTKLEHKPVKDAKFPALIVFTNMDTTGMK